MSSWLVELAHQPMPKDGEHALLAHARNALFSSAKISTSDDAACNVGSVPNAVLGLEPVFEGAEAPVPDMSMCRRYFVIVFIR